VLIAKKEATTEDTTWYNLYSDGWCEQGGQTSGITNTTTVTFLKPYVDTNYFNTVYMISGGSNTNYYYGDNKTTIRTTTSFTFIVNQSESWVCNWQACGYTDISNIDSTLYFYVGETVQNANLINAGRIEEKLGTIISDNSSIIAGYAMPSSRYIDLTLGASGTEYTAPANGWFILNKIAGSDWYYCTLTNNNTGEYDFRSDYRTSPCTPRVYARQGDVIKAEYNATGALIYFRFYYAEGNK
jgi:hypothetical protein